MFLPVQRAHPSTSVQGRIDGFNRALNETGLPPALQILAERSPGVPFEELGYDATRIAELVSQGIVATEA